MNNYLKLTAITFGISGAIVGGYYGVEALTNHSIPVIVRNTIEKRLKEDGYTIFNLTNEQWQEKFVQFKGGEKLTKLAAILKEEKTDDFVVTKEQDNKEGGEELKKWCWKVLDLEIEKVTENKSIENAKSFCAELKSNAQSSPTTIVTEPSSSG